MRELLVERLRVGVIHLASDFPEHDVTGSIPRRITRTAIWIAARLPPTLLGGQKRMVARVTFKL